MNFYRYFYNIEEIFSKITDINSSDTEEYLKFIEKKALASKTYNIDYVKKRLETEEKMRECFTAKGGKPKLKHPNYLVLENCDYWFYDVKNAFASLVLDSSLFPREVISFTYGDSIPTFDDAFFDGKEYRKNVYTIDEIEQLISKYSLPQLWNENGKYGPENYIEVQIWSDEVLLNYDIKKTKDIFKTLNLFFDAIIDGNKPIKVSLNSFPAQMSLEEIKNNYIINKLYDKFKNLYIKDKMHGIEHAYRTAVYMLLIGEIANVDEKFLETMLITAFAHDIGRKYSRKEDHGFIGAQILPKFIKINNEDMKIVQTAITAHSIENLDLYIKINSISDRESKLLLWLKDVDTLDYIRFGVREYNPSLLRTEEAKRLVKFAAQLNLYMHVYPNDDYKILKK